MKHFNPRLLAGAAKIPRALETKDADDATKLIGDVKKDVDTLMTGWEEFKKVNDERLKAIEKKGGADALTEEKLKRIETTIAALEPIGQKLVAIEAAAKDQKAKAEELELKLGRIDLTPASPEAKKAELQKRVDAWGRGVIAAIALGVPNLNDDQRKAIEAATLEAKALGISNDTTGGYLAPIEYVAELIKGVTEVSPVRSLVRVRKTSQKAFQMPKRTGQFSAQWVADQGTRSETTGLAFGMNEVPMHEMYALIDVSQQNLEDSAFDLEALITEEATEQFAVAEGAAVVSGTGVGRPQGFLNSAAGVSTTNSGSATTIADANGQADGIISLFHALKTAYTRNASWALNRLTLGSVRKLKDTNKQYIWQPGIANGVPNTILGASYVETPDMPNEGAGLTPIAFGDFFKAYILADRISMEMLRDPYTQATSGNLRFIFRRRIGGQVVLAEAIRTLTCAT